VNVADEARDERAFLREDGQRGQQWRATGAFFLFKHAGVRVLGNLTIFAGNDSRWGRRKSNFRE